MIKIEFQYGFICEYDCNEIDGYTLLESYTKLSSCPKDFTALALNVNGNIIDLRDKVKKDSYVYFITPQQEEGLEIIRHDCAHILANAVKNLYPSAKIAIGPTNSEGFFYDFDTETPIGEEELKNIEKEMHSIVKKNHHIQKIESSKSDAYNLFKQKNETYKIEILNKIPKDEIVTLYKQGEFIDLCRGPHGKTTGFIKNFKLTKVSGAYWKSDSNNKMLTRICGTAHYTKQELKDHFNKIEEAKKRDHRILGSKMELFHLQEDSKGGVFWHPRGWALYLKLQDYIRKKLQTFDYQEIRTPSLLDKKLWEKSGHWDKFAENMFVTGSENETLAIKPMNCPGHVQIFKSKIRSYKDLPIRFSEFGSCTRNEPSGSLYGLMRVREFVQDDAHIFCTQDQITNETILFCNMLREVYKELGFNDFFIKFADRPKNKSGSEDVWNKAENCLKTAINDSGLSYTINSGEGAFYGPKLEFVLKDAIGRNWQCGTLQLDFVLPERLGAQYIGSDGFKHYPVMIHRAILGTFERFIGILIEHNNGKIPIFISPTQVVVVTINNSVDDYAQNLINILKKNNISSILDNRNEKINYKIRQHLTMKIPFIWVVGENEKKDSTVSVRDFSGSSKVLLIEEALNLCYK